MNTTSADPGASEWKGDVSGSYGASVCVGSGSTLGGWGRAVSTTPVDSPGGPVVKNPPASAGDTGLSPVREDPHASRQLDLQATTEPPSPPQAGARPQGRSPSSLQLEKAHVQQRGPQNKLN